MFRPDPKPTPKPKKAKKALNFVSKRTSKKMGEYSRLKKSFIVGKICPVYPHLKPLPRP